VRVVANGESACIDSLDEAGLRGILSRAANFFHKLTTKGEDGKDVEVSPPLDVVRDILSLKDWEFPHLLAITTTPVIRQNGTILSTLGYDDSTMLFYYSRSKLPTIPDCPTEEEIHDAVQLVKELLWDFPFDSEASQANAVAALFSPILRPLIDGLIPLTVIDKPQQGTGASLLCEIIALISTGRNAVMTAGFRNDEEWRKNITTTLLRGRQIVVIDNVDGDLYAPSLAGLLTMHVWSDRVLGRNEDVLIPNTTCWFTNGNNIKLRGDLPRRSYWIRLDAQEAQPWLRSPSEFRHPNIVAWARENRGKILAGILTIARAWVLTGKPIPDDVPVIGNFESWCYTIAGILNFTGIKGFLGNLQSMYTMADPETPGWMVFLEVWYEIFGNEPVSTSEIIKKLKSDDNLCNSLPGSLGDVEDKKFAQKLGSALSRRLQMRFTNGLVITKAGKKQHAVLWKVDKAANLASPIFSFGGEAGEACLYQAPGEKNDGEKMEIEKNIEGGGVEQASPDSHLATKPGEAQSPDESPTDSDQASDEIDEFLRSEGML
jgi:hypothetical protein